MYITYLKLRGGRNEIPYPLTYNAIAQLALEISGFNEAGAIPTGITISVPHPGFEANAVIITRSNHLDYDGAMDEPVFYWVERRTQTYLECTLWGSPTAVANGTAEFKWTRCTPPQSNFDFYPDTALSTAHTTSTEAFQVGPGAAVAVTLTSDPTTDEALHQAWHTSLNSFDYSPVTYVLCNESGNPLTDSAAQAALVAFCGWVTSGLKWAYVRRIQVVPISLVNTSSGAITNPDLLVAGSSYLSAIRECSRYYVGSVGPGLLGLLGDEFDHVTRRLSRASIQNYNNSVLEFDLSSFNQPRVLLAASIVDGINPYVIVTEGNPPQDDFEPPALYSAIQTPEIIAFGDTFTSWYTENKSSLEAAQTRADASLTIAVGSAIASLATTAINPAVGVGGLIASGLGVYNAVTSKQDVYNQQVMATANAKRGVVSAGTAGGAFTNDNRSRWLHCSVAVPSVKDRKWNRELIRRRGIATSSYGTPDLTGFRYRAYTGVINRIKASGLLCVTESELIDAANTELSGGVVFYKNYNYLYDYSPYEA